MDEQDVQAGLLSAERLRGWLRRWVARTAEISEAEVREDAPLKSLGLSSRDAVVLSGDLERLTGLRLDPTIAYEYPTIEALAARLSQLQAGPTDGTGSTGAERAWAGSARTVDEPAALADRDIAVVGLAARYPGAESTPELWDLLIEGRDGTGQPPVGRWSEYAGEPTLARLMEEQPLAGGYLKDLSSFDAEFFGISPVEAANMDPQQRIALELAWRALEDAGLPANQLRGGNVGVYLGTTNNDYAMLIAADPAEAHPYALTGTSSAVIANRISYYFDFRGPSVAVDTACSSSLVAVHQAVRALRHGDADVALAGGVNILSSPFVTTAFGQLGVLSPSGHIHAFSDDADGFVRSDGAGILVLKRVRDAVRDGDPIRAVIKGSAINSDGHSNGITAPTPEAQVDVLRRAYADARVAPQQMDYVEAHGTGTILGDPIEVRALGEVLGAGRDAAAPLLVGSAKSNLGHTEAAAGAAGLAKVVLAMDHGVLPASLHFSAPNHFIDFEAAHLEVVEDPREWPAYSGRRLAGVSGFGFGGTNAHVVVSSFEASDYAELHAGDPQPRAELDAPGDPTALLVVSGTVPSRRADAAAQLADWLEAHPDVDLTAVERATARHNHGRSRAAITADSAEEAVRLLRRVAQGTKMQGIQLADAPADHGPVFVYSGFGSQHRKMAKELLGISPLFRERMRDLDTVVVREAGWSMLGIIEDDAQTYNTETAQVTITAVQIALTDLLAQLGVRPGAVTAMSMGEIAAGYATGGLSAQDAMTIACHRSRLMGEGESMLAKDQQGAMAVVELGTEDLERLGAEDTAFEGIEAAVYTAPGMTTVGGPREAVAVLVERLEAEGKFARLLNVKGAGHTSALDPILGELAAEIAGIEPRPIHTPLISSVDRRRTYQPGVVVHTSDYFLRCTRQPVWFQDATEAAFEAGATTLVEIAPNPVALMGMMATAFATGHPDAQLLFTLKRKVPAAEGLRSLLATLYAAGMPVDLRRLHGHGPVAAIPGVPWRRQRHWTTARPSSGAPARLPGARVDLPDGTVAFAGDAAWAPSSVAVVESAAQAVEPAAMVVAHEERAVLPPSGGITTMVARSLGGMSIRVHLAADGALLAEGFATTEEQRVSAAPLPEAGVAEIAPSPEPAEPSARRWDPTSGETVEGRLRSIVSETMGYDASDLPLELPLIDLGLDSLMGMRIKNRIENDFQIPELQVQMLRDASVADVIALVKEKVAAEAGETTGVAGPEPEPSLAGATTPSARVEPPEQLDAPRKGGVGVAPRDASERLVFATWATCTGAAAAGVTSALPEISEAQAAAVAERLTERAGVEITADQVREAETLEPLANAVREGLETDVEGTIRVLRERPEGSTRPAVFLFHPAGGSSVVYAPLMRRLPEDVPVYGVERLEDSLEERAAAYLPDIQERAAGLPVVLGGWSFGGALAMEVAHQIAEKELPVDVQLIALLDTVQPAEPVPDTPEETRARWQRYAAFAKKTYGLDFPVPVELLDTLGEDAVLAALAEFLATTDASEHGLAPGVLEHQRASFVDNRILDRLDLSRWAHLGIPVVLYRAERMHDGAIELEPAYERVKPDGGWSGIVDQLDVVQLRGDHLAVVDEPEIATVGADLTQRLAALGLR